MSPLQTHLLKPRRQLFFSHQWLPISFPEALYHEALYHEALYQVPMLLVEGIILVVKVVMFQAVEEVHLAKAHSENNKTVCTATWSTRAGR